MTEKKRGYGIVSIGCALMALGIQNFMEPAHLVAGGLSGLGIILDDMAKRFLGIPIPLWFFNVVLNLPLFLLAWWKKGRRYLSTTILTALLFSLMLFVASFLPMYEGDILLASVYGGVLTGAGLGMVLLGGTTTGGVDLAAALLHHKWQYVSVATLVFFMDVAIILLGTVSFGVEHSLYAILSIFVVEKCAHWVMEGTGDVRAAAVVSAKAAQIKKELESRMNSHFVEIAEGFSPYGADKRVLFCVFTKKEIGTVKNIIINIDRTALFLLMDVREVLGTDMEA